MKRNFSKDDFMGKELELEYHKKLLETLTFKY